VEKVDDGLDATVFRSAAFGPITTKQTPGSDSVKRWGIA
jgi:hypothetical protein